MISPSPVVNTKQHEPAYRNLDVEIKVEKGVQDKTVQMDGMIRN